MKIISTVFFLLVATTLMSVDIKLIQKIPVSQGKVILEGPVSLQVSDDDIIYITDLKAGSIKTFNQEGQFLSTWGTKGAGPKEFLFPFFSHYDNGLLAVMDFGKRKIIVLKKNGKAGLKEKMILPCRSAGDDIILRNGRVLVSGYILDENEKSFHLYSRSLTKEDDVIFLLPTEMKYGYKSYNEYRKKSNNTIEFRALGPMCYCDVAGNHVYSVWQANLNIFKINLTTKKISTFGNTTANYHRPYATDRMEKARVTRNSKLDDEKKKMSFIKGLFVNNKYVFVYYDKAPYVEGKPQSVLQFYTLDGKFLKEIVTDNFLSNLSFFRKSDNTFFCSQRSKNDDDSMYIMKYRITD